LFQGRYNYSFDEKHTFNNQIYRKEIIMKRTRKITGIVISLMLVLIVSENIFAAVATVGATTHNATNINVNEPKEAEDAKKEITYHVRNILGSLRTIKNNNDMGDIDFSDLALGKKIPLFECKNDCLLPILGIEIYPIISNNEWIATAIVSADENKEVNVTISRVYVDEYQKKSDNNETLLPVSIVYDVNTSYLIIGNDYIEVEHYDNIEGRSLFKNCSLLGLNSEVVYPANDISIPEDDDSTINSISSVVWLGVPSYIQPTSNTCWATCIVAIIRYYNGVQLTPFSVCYAAGLNTNSAATVYQSAGMISYYGYGYGKNGNNHYFYYSIYFTDLVSEFYTDSAPIFLGFSGLNNQMVIVRYPIWIRLMVPIRPHMCLQMEI